MKLRQGKVEKIPDNGIRTSCREFLFGLITGNSYTLEASSLSRTNAGGGIFDGYGCLGWAVDTNTGQAIDVGIGFPFGNLIASNYCCEVCQQAQACQDGLGPACTCGRGHGHWDSRPANAFNKLEDPRNWHHG